MELNSQQVYWFYENGRYTLGKLSAGYPCTIFEKQLPSFSRSDEEDLQTLQANYQVDEDGTLTIFNPAVVEWEEITAPILKKSGFHIIGEFGMNTGKIPSDRMLKAAHDYYRKLGKQIYEINLSLEKEELKSVFKRTSADGICIWWEQEDWTYLRPSNLDDDYIFIDFSLPLHYDVWSVRGLIILKSAIQGKSVITLKVPKCFIGQVIGKGGCNVKKIAKELGVRYINVEPNTEYRL